MVQRVIIHAGTMKTGTTALQMYMNDRREEHAKLGVYYPQTPDGRFNHQQLLSALKNGNGSALVAAVAKGISESPKNTHTVFFSHEGIFEGWHRFAPHRREDFQKLATIYPLEVWAFFREPLQLMMSFHNQYAKRVRLDLKGQAHLTLEQRLNDPHFISNCDYKGFVKSVEKQIKPKKVRVMAYRGATVRDTLQALGLPWGVEEDHVNLSVSEKALHAIEQLRTANLTLDEKERAAQMVLDNDDHALPRMAPPEAVVAAAMGFRTASEFLRTIDGGQLGDYWPDTDACVASRADVAMPHYTEEEEVEARKASAAAAVAAAALLEKIVAEALAEAEQSSMEDDGKADLEASAPDTEFEVSAGEPAIGNATAEAPSEAVVEAAPQADKAVASAKRSGSKRATAT